MPAKKKLRKNAEGSRGKRLLVSGAALVVLAAAAVYLLLSTVEGGAAGGAVVAGPPPIVFEPGSVDFGSMPPNQIRSREVSVVNTGEAAVQVVTARSSCACLNPVVAPTTLQPGARAAMTLHMDSQRNPGPFNGTVSVVVAGYEEPATLRVQRTTVVQ